MNLVDLIIIVAAAASAAHGYFRGAAIGICSIAGFCGGLLLGAYLSPFVIDRLHNPVDRTVAAVVIVFGLAIVLGGIGERLGAKARTALRVLLLGPVDSILGAILAVVTSLLAVWLMAGILFALGDVPSLTRPVAQSAIVKALVRTLPAAPSVLAHVGAVLEPTGLPQVFSGLEPALAQPLPTPADPEVAAAEAAGENSTLKVQGVGCGGIKSGSGWVVAPDYVVTNAHVVSGISLPEVYDRTGRRHANVTVVLYDPEVDLAVLYVPGLDDKPLPLDAASAPRGTAGAVLGYPGGGPFTVVPAALLSSLSAVDRDIYGRNATTRSVYELQADVRPGNSGGPFISSTGYVIGVVFSASTTYPNVGYALTGAEVAPDISKAIHLTSGVSTQTCAG
ncbi:MAG TPA: MarP family serine protease [Acidimicrobiia bacterium]|nr:MarP family serine protease [Acidimicrobiia bacterium]